MRKMLIALIVALATVLTPAFVTTAPAAHAAAKTAAVIKTPEPMVNYYYNKQKLDPRCMKGRVICISMKQRMLTYVVNGKRVVAMQARFGSRKYPTRRGVFYVYAKYVHYRSRAYGSQMPYSMFFDNGRAVHYSANFASVGYRSTSHGCANVRDMKALKYLYTYVPMGTKVVVY